MNKQYNKVLKLIIGDEVYNMFLNTLFKDIYSNFPDIIVDNIEILLNTFSKIILSLSFNNEKGLQTTKIKLIENTTININIEDFKIIYKNFIEEVKRFKEDLLFIN